MAHIEQVYGSFTGGDPRRFSPDTEINTPAEIAAWEAACAEWNAGNEVDRGPGCQTFGDGSTFAGTGFGLGVTTIDDCTCDEAPEEWAGTPGGDE